MNDNVELADSLEPLPSGHLQHCLRQTCTLKRKLRGSIFDLPEVVYGEGDVDSSRSRPRKVNNLYVIYLWLLYHKRLRFAVKSHLNAV